MSEFATIVGFIAGLVTTAANFPQVWKTYRTKSGEGLSFRTLLTLAIGLGIWIIYGIMIKSLPLIATNVVVFLLISSLMADPRTELLIMHLKGILAGKKEREALASVFVKETYVSGCKDSKRRPMLYKQLGLWQGTMNVQLPPKQMVVS